MAKKTRKQASSTPPHTTAEFAPQALVDFAEEMGAFLGNTERKASAWMDQRKVVAEQLAAIRDKASTLLTQLGHTAEAYVPEAAVAAIASATKTVRRTMSPEARRKIAAAQKKRWAKKRRLAKQAS